VSTAQVDHRARDQGAGVRFAAATHPEASPDVLAVLAHDADAMVRRPEPRSRPGLMGPLCRLSAQRPVASRCHDPVP